MEQTEQPAERLLNVVEAAHYLNVAPDTLRIWARSGQIPCGRLGNRGDFRFRMADLVAFAFRENPCFRGTPASDLRGEQVA